MHPDFTRFQAFGAGHGLDFVVMKRLGVVIL